MTADTTLQPGETLQEGRYRIEGLIGQGAYAQVYRATHRDLHVTRALKVLRRDAPGVGSSDVESYRRRFQLEAQLGAHIDDPHVIRVYDYFEEGGRLVLVMSYADGGSVADRLGREGPLPWREVARLIREAAAGLHVLHEELDAVHRDVKPSNILLDGAGHAMIADLGLAQIPGVAMSDRSVLGSRAGTHPGTPQYRSPEHEGSDTLAPTADVYSLGCVAFEMLTGQAWKLVRHRVARARDLCADVPAWLDTVVMRMLKETPGLNVADTADPAKRYVAMDRVIAALTPGDNHRNRSPVAWVIGGILALLLLTWIGSGDGAPLRTQPAYGEPTDSPTTTLALPDTTTTTSVTSPSLTPAASPTRTPSPSPTHTRTVSPSPEPTHTAAPSRTPTDAPHSTTTQPTTPAITLISPAAGNQMKNPLSFSWNGALASGQTYLLRAWHVETAHLLQTRTSSTSYQSDVPADKIGAWRWHVAIVAGDTVVQQSADSEFWFNPMPGVEGGGASEEPGEPTTEPTSAPYPAPDR